MIEDAQLSEDAALFALMAAALAEENRHGAYGHHRYDEHVATGLAETSRKWPSNAEAVDALLPIARRLVDLVRAPLLAEVATAKEEVDALYRLEQEARHDSAESFRVVVRLDAELTKVRAALAEARLRGALLAEAAEKLSRVVKRPSREGSGGYEIVSTADVVDAKLRYWKALPEEDSGRV